MTTFIAGWTLGVVTVLVVFAIGATWDAWAARRRESR